MRASTQRIAEVYNDTKRYPTAMDAAEALGVSPRTLREYVAAVRREGALKLIERSKLQSYEAPNPGGETHSIPQIDGPEEDINSLLDRTMKHNERKADYHNKRQCVKIPIKIDGPIGVVGLPDQHLNNPGTLLRKAFNDADIIRNTEGLFCVAVGDWLDNFIIGRLERERRGDVMSHDDANRIMEHYVKLIGPSCIAAVGGNHNDWPHMLGGVDLLGRIFSELGLSAIYDADEVRVKLRLPNGREFTHLARHIFPGHSKYNTGHGVLSWMLDRWQGEDVLWGGHIHSSSHVAITREWEGKERVVHGVQLASYKVLDGYAIKRGFRKNTPFVVPMVIHRPDSPNSMFFEDFEEGCDYLRFLRKSK